MGLVNAVLWLITSCPERVKDGQGCRGGQCRPVPMHLLAQVALSVFRPKEENRKV